MCLSAHMPEFCMHGGALVTVLRISISITRCSQLSAFVLVRVTVGPLVAVSTGQIPGARWWRRRGRRGVGWRRRGRGHVARATVVSTCLWRALKTFRPALSSMSGVPPALPPVVVAFLVEVPVGTWRMRSTFLHLDLLAYTHAVCSTCIPELFMTAHFSHSCSSLAF
jgi:hypothetical protein